MGQSSLCKDEDQTVPLRHNVTRILFTVWLAVGLQTPTQSIKTDLRTNLLQILLMLLACCVNTPIRNNGFHDLRSAFCKVFCILCERSLNLLRAGVQALLNKHALTQAKAERAPIR